MKFHDITCEYGTYLVQGADGPLPRVLADGDLHEEQGQAAEQEHDEVGDEEGTAAGLQGGNRRLNSTFPLFLREPLGVSSFLILIMLGARLHMYSM